MNSMIHRTENKLNWMARQLRGMNKEDEIIKWFKAMQAGHNLLVEAYRHKELWETQRSTQRRSIIRRNLRRSCAAPTNNYIKPQNLGRRSHGKLNNLSVAVDRLEKLVDKAQKLERDGKLLNNNTTPRRVKRRRESNSSLEAKEIGTPEEAMESVDMTVQPHYKGMSPQETTDTEEKNKAMNIIQEETILSGVVQTDTNEVHNQNNERKEFTTVVERNISSGDGEVVIRSGINHVENYKGIELQERTRSAIWRRLEEEGKNRDYWTKDPQKLELQFLTEDVEDELGVKRGELIKDERSRQTIMQIVDIFFSNKET